ncbi:MAG: hypothetical protein ACXV7D_03590, partial [Thermoanaerobaculia bacterium]
MAEDNAAEVPPRSETNQSQQDDARRSKHISEAQGTSKPSLTSRADRNIDLAMNALLAFIILFTFHDVVFGGKSLLPSDNLNPLDERFLPQNYGPHFVAERKWTARNLDFATNVRDAGASWWQGEPSSEFLKRSLRRFEFPFWDPYIGAGTPSMSNLVPAYLFPPNLVVVLLGNGSLVRNLYILALLFFASTCTYAFLRDHQLSPPASIAGALAFLFCGGLMQTAPSIIGQPVACLPFILLLTSRFIDDPVGRAWKIALGYAVVSLASLPPLLLGVFISGAGYVAAAIFFHRPPRADISLLLKRYAVAVAVAGLLVGAYCLPALMTILTSPHVRQYYSTAATAVLRPKQLFELFSPTIMGGRQIYINATFPPLSDQSFYYAGVSAVGLAIIALLTRPRFAQRLHLFALVSLVVIVMKLIGLPPVQWLALTPVLRSVHFSAYYGIFVDFYVALLAAIAVET